MVRTRSFWIAVAIGIVAGCSSSRHQSCSNGDCCPTCEKPGFMDRLRSLFGRDNGNDCCCDPDCSSCCEGGPILSDGPVIMDSPPGSVPLQTLPAPTPLPPQSGVPPLSPPPASRLVPQPLAQPQQYTPLR